MMASFSKIANHRIISLPDGFNPEQRSSYLKLPPDYQTSCWDAHHSPQCVVSLTEMNNKLSLLSYNTFLVVSGWRSERVAYTKGLKSFFNSLLSTHQSGFQPYQATETALQCHQWLLADQIQWSIPSVMLLDQSVAFAADYFFLLLIIHWHPQHLIFLLLGLPFFISLLSRFCLISLTSKHNIPKGLGLWLLSVLTPFITSSPSLVNIIYADDMFLCIHSPHPKIHISWIQKSD